MTPGAPRPESSVRAAATPRSVEVRCPQCFSRRFVSADRFAYVYADGPWKIVVCKDCSLMYANPRPAFEDWDLLYPEDYAAYRSSDAAPSWRKRARWAAERWLGRLRSKGEAPGVDALLAPFILGAGERQAASSPQPGVVLDLGCGAGEYLARMKRLGWEVHGVDRNQNAAAIARTRHDISVTVDHIPSRLTPQAGFDLVTAWEVIEHLDRPRQALAWIRAILKPSGRLALTTPNQAGWAARFFGPAWHGLDLPRHFSHFTGASLARMLRSEGFRVVHQSTIGHSGWIRHSARTASAMEHPWRKRVFRSKVLSRAASSLACRLGAGESLFIIATPV